MEPADYAVLARGAALFNEGEYFACHEVWEELWKHSIGEERAALQGLIQAAVAILHAARGNHSGAQSVYRKAKRNLAGVADNCLGLRVGALRSSLQVYFEQLAADRADAAKADARGAAATNGRRPIRPQLQCYQNRCDLK